MKSNASTFVNRQKISTNSLTLLARSVASILTSCLESLFLHLFHWHVQNVTITFHSEELLPFLSVIYSFLPPFSTN